MDCRKVPLQGFQVLLFRPLNELCCNIFEILELEELSTQNVAEPTIVEQYLQKVLPFLDHLLVAQRLKQVGTQHASAPIGQASKVSDEAAFFEIGLGVEEYFEGGNSLRLDDEEVLQGVPADLQGRVTEFSLIDILKVEDESVKGSVSDELVVRVILLFVPTLIINLKSFGLVKDDSPEVSEVGSLEGVGHLLDEGGVLEAWGVDDLQGEEALDSRQSPKVC